MFSLLIGGSQLNRGTGSTRQTRGLGPGARGPPPPPRDNMNAPRTPGATRKGKFLAPIPLYDRLYGFVSVRVSVCGLIFERY